jgi:transposase
MWIRQEPACQAIAAIPGIGLLTATALVATVGQVATFKSGREFAAYVGLVPRQRGTGGVVRLGSISKRGDPYLRTLLIHGARAVLYGAKQRPPWAEALMQRRPANVAVVAMANKTARVAWAILAHRTAYRGDFLSAVA